MMDLDNLPTHPLPEEENQHFEPFSKKIDAFPTYFNMLAAQDKLSRKQAMSFTAHDELSCRR